MNVVHDHPPMSRPRAFVIALALLLTLGCWSSDSLFITLTATPIATPTRQASALDSRYQIGDTAVIAAQGIGAVYLTENPEPVTRRNRVPNAACHPNSRVEIRDVEQVDGITYYRVVCNNTPGWLEESSLSAPEGN